MFNLDRLILVQAEKEVLISLFFQFLVIQNFDFNKTSLLFGYFLGVCARRRVNLSEFANLYFEGKTQEILVLLKEAPPL
jgi:hypothetical protein